MGHGIQRYYICFIIIINLVVILFIIGILLAMDSYMNLQLGNTEEYINGELAGNLGEVCLI